MKKILISIVFPLFFVIVIWLINFQLVYGDLSLLSQTHIDLKAMFNKFALNTDFSTDFGFTFRNMVQTFKQISSSSLTSSILGGMGIDTTSSTGWIIVLHGVDAFTNPILSILYPVLLFGYLCVLVVQFLGVTTIVATAIFDFIFNPIFIVHNSTLVPPVTPIPSIPPVIPPRI